MTSETGISIKSYADGDPIPLFYNKIYSDNTEIQYAYNELPFICAASGQPKPGHTSPHTSLISGHKISLNLGEVLRGDRITVSDFDLQMGKDVEMKLLCNKEVDKDALLRAQDVIKNDYFAEWIVDNLPGATQFVTQDRSRKYHAAGFKLGYESENSKSGDSKVFINNHFTIVIRWNKAPGTDGHDGRKVIVGFEVYPRSIEAENRDQNGIPNEVQNLQAGMMLKLPAASSNRTKFAREIYSAASTKGAGTTFIPFTYSVFFREEDEIDWNHRWDRYFVTQEDTQNIHWLAIINSLVILGLLSTVVAVVLARTVYGDIKGQKEHKLDDGKSKRFRPRSPQVLGEKGTLVDPMIESGREADDFSEDEALDEITGWKLVHADVFRPPPHGQWLAPLVGSGVQLLFVALGLLLLSCLGVLNPSFRGGFVSVGAGLFIFTGLIAGYVSSRIFKTFGGTMWRRNVLVVSNAARSRCRHEGKLTEQQTAILVPGLVFAISFILNFFVWAQASSTALPFTTLIALVALWLLIQLPLVYAGSYYGYNKHGAIEHPLKASAIPRQVPPQPFWSRKSSVVMLAGLVPFAVVFIELMFVFKSVWQDKSGFYYVFGFLAVVSLVLLTAVVEVTIVTTYLLLCNEVSSSENFVVKAPNQGKADATVELPLVVAFFPRRIFVGHMDIRLYCLVLRNKTAYSGLCFVTSVFQLQRSWMRDLWIAHGHSGICHSICIC